jgi:hypothetical protein
LKLGLYKNNILELIETLHAIQTGDLRMGSVARVIDCCQAPVDTFQCIYKLGGICFASDYPAPTGKCVPNACKPFATVRIRIHSLKHNLTLRKISL